MNRMNVKDRIEGKTVMQVAHEFTKLAKENPEAIVTVEVDEYFGVKVPRVIITKTKGK